MDRNTEHQLQNDPLFRRVVDSLVNQLLDEFGLTADEVMRAANAAIAIAAEREAMRIAHGEISLRKCGDHIAREAEMRRRVNEAMLLSVVQLPR